MKVKDLLEEAERCKAEYGEDFLNWDIYTEQCDENDKEYKRGKQNWEILHCGEEWEYFKCCGFWTLFPKEKIFTINVNY